MPDFGEDRDLAFQYRAWLVAFALTWALMLAVSAGRAG